MAYFVPPAGGWGSLEVTFVLSLEEFVSGLLAWDLDLLFDLLFDFKVGLPGAAGRPRLSDLLEACTGVLNKVSVTALVSLLTGPASAELTGAAVVSETGGWVVVSRSL